jgi:hypothetical protein
MGIVKLIKRQKGRRAEWQKGRMTEGQKGVKEKFTCVSASPATYVRAYGGIYDLRDKNFEKAKPIVY